MAPPTALLLAISAAAAAAVAAATAASAAADRFGAEGAALLQEDDTCRLGEDSEGAPCALSALQLRARKVAPAAPPPAAAAVPTPGAAAPDAGAAAPEGASALATGVAVENSVGACYISQCGCPGAFNQSWCTVESQVASLWCQQSPENCGSGNCGIWCPGVGVLPPTEPPLAKSKVIVSSPEEFVAALKAVIATDSCTTQYEVSTTLFGTATSYNASEQSGIQRLARSPQKPLAWLAGAEALSSFLNSESVGCCDVSTLSACLCRIAQAVGIIDLAAGVSYLDPVPPFQYVYAVVNAEVTNTTTDPNAVGQVDVLVPTWDVLLDVMGASFEYTLGAGAASNCAASAEVRSILRGSSYQALFQTYRAKFEGFGASEQQCQVQGDAVAFFTEHAAEVCTDHVIARLYLCTFLDANPMFMGTGLTSGGHKEYITVPNPSVASIQVAPASASILNFELSQEAGAFSCANGNA